jgi:hypothetical protein
MIQADDRTAGRLAGEEPLRDDLEGPVPAESEALVVVGREVGLDIAHVLASALRHEPVHHLLVVASVRRHAHIASHRSTNFAKLSNEYNARSPARLSTGSAT